MKLKFIFNTVRLGAAPKADFGADPKPAALAILRAVAAAFALILAFAVACNSRALAQPEAMFPHFKDSRFWLSGQANFIFQTHPPFRAAYSGIHSLSPNYEKATSRVLTLYTGVRLNNSTEFSSTLKRLADPPSARASASPAIPTSISCAILCSARRPIYAAA
jgi:hypothetical protein